MDCSSNQVSIAGSLLTPAASCEARAGAQFFSSKQRHFDVSLLVEITLVMVIAVLLIKVIASSPFSSSGWFIAPALLVAAALVPTAVRGNRFPAIGFSNKQIKLTVFVLCQVCAVIFPVMLIGLWLLKSCGFALPLRPVLPQNHNWACWILYQFMYVAVAEEVFFRGYIQSNILALTSAANLGGRPPSCFRKKAGGQIGISIVLSSACFAVAHIIVGGQIISVLTFLPGLVLGWLFVRTRSLLAPILFHGLANTCYCILAIHFVGT